jgi:2-phosphosulfolactate phosphatase
MDEGSEGPTRAEVLHLAGHGAQGRLGCWAGKPFLKRLSQVREADLGRDGSEGLGDLLPVRRSFGPEILPLGRWRPGSDRVTGRDRFAEIRLGQPYLTLAFRDGVDKNTAGLARWHVFTGRADSRSAAVRVTHETPQAHRKDRRCDTDNSLGASGRACAIMIGMNSRFLGIAELVEAPSVAVVVDVMRAFTVAAWAFAQGAEKIVLAESLDDALALKARHPDWVALKDGPPAPGFDAVNSPGLLRSIDLGGRTVVQKTTAGTVGALAVKEASLVLCASFVVAEATARRLRTSKSDSVTFVVTGEDGQADEDLACAQYIARRVAEAGTDAAEFLHRAAESRAAAELAEGVRQGVHPDDVALCLELDRFPFAMVAALEDSLMVLRPCAEASLTDEASI